MQVLPDINKTKTTSRRIADLRYYSSRSKRKIKCIQRYSTRELSWNKEPHYRWMSTPWLSSTFHSSSFWAERENQVLQEGLCLAPHHPWEHPPQRWKSMPLLLKEREYHPRKYFPRKVALFLMVTERHYQTSSRWSLCWMTYLENQPANWETKNSATTESEMIKFPRGALVALDPKVISFR